MKKVRRALQDILIQSLNTQQMAHLGREVDSSFDLYEYSGFGDKIVIPRKVAADCILQYFQAEGPILAFIAFMLSRNGQGMSGGVIRLKGEGRLLEYLRELGWEFDPENARFQKEQSVRQTGWGFMRAGEEYTLSFASIDIVSSSELVRTNVKEDVEVTLTRLRAYIQKHVDFWDGRIWSWYGDGGMAVFHGEDSAPMSVLSMASIVNYLPVFNISENQLRPENDVKLRIGMHYGSCLYNDDVNKISSQDIKISQEIEKSFADPNSLALSEALCRLLPQEIRKSFEVSSEYRGMRVYRYHP